MLVSDGHGVLAPLKSFVLTSATDLRNIKQQVVRSTQIKTAHTVRFLRLLPSVCLNETHS
jgi:hypothetical protein